MAFLTKEECVRRHRLLWNYIADEILEQGEVPWNYKGRAFEHFGWNISNGYIFSYCWACYYYYMKRFEMVDDPKCARENEVDDCPYCLFNWTTDESNHCSNKGALYDQFLNLKRSNNWKEAAIIARKIANMPVREDV